MDKAAPGTGTLKTGLTIGGVTYKDFELRRPTAQDFFDAEEEVPSSRSIAFKAAVVARVLKHIGDYTGPFTVKILGKLTPGDLEMLIAAHAELEEAGEADGDDAKRNGAPS